MQYWKRNLIFVWICQFLTLVGMSSIVPFLPLYIRELGVENVGNTAQWSGLVFAGPFFISFFLAPIWGSLGDKYGRKLLTIRAIFGLALAQIFVGLSQNVHQLMLARLFQGALSGFTPASMALVAANTPKDKTAHSLGILQTATASGVVLGPFIGGLIADFLGYRSVFFIVSGLLIVNGFLFILFVQEINKVDKSQRKYKVIENWKFFLTKPNLRIIGIMVAVTSLGAAFTRPIFTLYYENFELETEFFATSAGLMYGILGIFTAISSAWWGKRASESGYKNNLIYAAIIVGAMFAAHAFVYNPYYLIPVRALLGFGYGGLLPLLFSMISDNVETERQSGMLGIGSSWQVLGNIIGPSFSGLITSLTNLRFPFVISGCLFIILAIISFFNIKK